MKKFVASLALGALLVVGFSFAQSNPTTDLSHESEPSIFSIEQPVSFF